METPRWVAATFMFGGRSGGSSWMACWDLVKMLVGGGREGEVTTYSRKRGFGRSPVFDEEVEDLLNGLEPRGVLLRCL